MSFLMFFTDNQGLMDLLEHEIKTTTDKLKRLKPCPLHFAMTDVVSDEIEKMLEMQII